MSKPKGKPVGRPRTGKRSDANFTPIMALVRKETHVAAKIALLREGKNRDFSELVQDLLSEWLKKRKEHT